MGCGFSSNTWIQHLGEGPCPFCGHSGVAQAPCCPSPSAVLRFEMGPCVSEIAAFHDKAAFWGRGSYLYVFKVILSFPYSVLPCHFLSPKSCIARNWVDIYFKLRSVKGHWFLVPAQRRRPHLISERIITILPSCHWGDTVCLENNNYPLRRQCFEEFYNTDKNCCWPVRKQFNTLLRLHNRWKNMQSSEGADSYLLHYVDCV